MRDDLLCRAVEFVDIRRVRKHLLQEDSERGDALDVASEPERWRCLALAPDGRIELRGSQRTEAPRLTECYSVRKAHTEYVPGVTVKSGSSHRAAALGVSNRCANSMKLALRVSGSATAGVTTYRVSSNPSVRFLFHSRAVSMGVLQ